MRNPKLIFLVALAAGINSQLPAQSRKPPRLIIRGDDMGFSHAGNEALIKSLKEGVETSIEVIVPSPWFPEAVELLKENPGVDVGIHLDLTSEWDNEKWRPITGPSSITDEAGYFYPFIWPNQNYPGRALLEHDWKPEDVEKELRAQIELGKKMLPGLSHVSAHMGCSGMTTEVGVIVEKLAKEFNLYINMDSVESAGYGGPHATSGEKISSFINMLSTLQPGKVYLFVDHPGLDTPELRAIHHRGYADVAIDRQGVVDTYTSEEVKAAILKKGVQLISYSDLKNQ